MKFKFKPQTCMLVAGIVTSAYATCYYQLTSATCFTSGTVVDNMSFLLNPGGTGIDTPIKASQDWVAQVNNVTTTNNGHQGYSSWSSISTPLACSGPAKFTDPVSGQNETISLWENNSCLGSPATVPVSPPYWGNVGTTTCS
jgi:hypothetical protein